MCQKLHTRFIWIYKDI